MTNLRSYLLSLVLLLAAFGCRTTAQEKLKIMAVFAHPDDETTVAPVLAKYAKTDDVYLVIATDGRYGVTDHAGIPAGDSLVEIRTEELKCACDALGINPPIQLGLEDGFGSFENRRRMVAQLDLLKERLQNTIDEINPDIVITFGPDADSGHPDHRLIGIFTTELLLKTPLDKKLYYFSYTKKQSDLYGSTWNLNYADVANLNTVISFSEEEEKQFLESIRCYQSQFSQEEMDAWITLEKGQENTLWFREHVQSATKKNSL